MQVRKNTSPASRRRRWSATPIYSMACRFLAVAGALALMPQPDAEAQAPARVPTLPEVTVKSPRDRSPSLAQPSLEIARERIERTPGGASVIDSEDYLKGRAATPVDALGYAPGVFVQERIPGAEESRLSIRGSGIQRTFPARGVRLLQDGVPLNLGDGSFDLQAVEPLAARYIEVYRGANALQYGATTLGGAVNFLSFTGFSAPPLLLRGEVGSYGYLRGQAAAAGVQGDTDYYASLSHFSQDGYQAQSKQGNQRLFANVGQRINDNLETRFYLLYALADTEQPGAISKTEIRNSPRVANPINVALNQHRDFNLARISNKTVYAWQEQRFELGAFYSYKAMFNPIFQVFDVNSNDLGLSLRYVSEAPVAGRRNLLTVGFNAVGTSGTQDRFVNVRGTAGARIGQADLSAASYDLYAENQHYVTPQTALVLGAQASRAPRKLGDKFLGDGDNSFDVTYSQVSPRLGARYELAPAVQVFGNVSRSFEPPSFVELAGGPTITRLRKQSAWTVELGSRGRVADAEWDAAWYRAEVRDELLNLNPGNPLNAVNAPRTLHQGVELGVTWTFFKSLALRGAYLWNDFRFDGDPVYGDNTLPGIPRQFLRLEAMYTTPGGFYIGPSVEWSPESYPVDMANTLSADSYAALGFKFGQRVGKGFSWFVDGRNLTDARYAATTDIIIDSRSPGAGGQNARVFNPGLGRSVFAGLEWRM